MNRDYLPAARDDGDPLPFLLDAKVDSYTAGQLTAIVPAIDGGARARPVFGRAGSWTLASFTIPKDGGTVIVRVPAEGDPLIVCQHTDGGLVLIQWQPA